jgi:hypothetical protein
MGFVQLRVASVCSMNITREDARSRGASYDDDDDAHSLVTRLLGRRSALVTGALSQVVR